MNRLRAQRSGAPERTPFLKRSAREEPEPLGPAGKKGRRDGFIRGAIPIGRNAKEQEIGATDTSGTGLAYRVPQDDTTLQPAKDRLDPGRHRYHPEPRQVRRDPDLPGRDARRRDRGGLEQTRRERRQGLCEPLARSTRVRTAQALRQSRPRGWPGRRQPLRRDVESVGPDESGSRAFSAEAVLSLHLVSAMSRRSDHASKRRSGETRRCMPPYLFYDCKCTLALCMPILGRHFRYPIFI